MDFLALSLSDMQVKALNPAREAGQVPGTFQISRTKRLDSPVRVLFKLSGTAAAGTDYADWTNKISQTNIFKVLNAMVTNVYDFYYVDLPADVASTNIDIVPITDSDAEGDESVTITVADTTNYRAGAQAKDTVIIAHNGHSNQAPGSGTAPSSGRHRIWTACGHAPSLMCGRWGIPTRRAAG